MLNMQLTYYYVTVRCVDDLFGDTPLERPLPAPFSSCNTLVQHRLLKISFILQVIALPSISFPQLHPLTWPACFTPIKLTRLEGGVPEPSRTYGSL